MKIKEVKIYIRIFELLGSPTLRLRIAGALDQLLDGA